MKECSKSIVRRMNDSNFIRRYFVGSGIDVGGKPDPLLIYKEFFPKLEVVRTWDWEDGDAEFMQGVEDESYDFIHASHCLEHLRDPIQGLKNWLRVIRPGGFLIITVPDEDMYEQGEFPSTFNRDHKWTFTIKKINSWSDKSINIVDLVEAMGATVEIERMLLLNSTFREYLPRYDQTLTPISECGIEFVLRKRKASELEFGRRYGERRQPPEEIRIHLNQYRDDLRTLKNANIDKPPFTNNSEM